MCIEILNSFEHFTSFISYIMSEQRSVWPLTQSLELTLYPYVLKIKTIIVVKQNFSKMPFVYYLQIHDLATLMQGCPSRRVAFLNFFVSQQLLFLFSKYLDTMSIRRIVSSVKQIFVSELKICHLFILYIIYIYSLD